MKVPNILIVDDEPEVLASLDDYLSKRLKCHITTVNNCEEALEILKTKDVDVLLQDLHFPTKLIGYDVIDYAKKEKSHIIILVISKYDDPAYVTRNEQEGNILFVPKPIVLAEVKRRIETTLAKRGGFDYKGSVK